MLLLPAAVLAFLACGGGGSGGGTAPPHSVTLGFAPPTTYTDGTPITDFAGYIMYYGPSPGNYDHSVDVGNVTTYSITLPEGTWYFAAKAYNSAGAQSNYSNEIEVKL